MKRKRRTHWCYRGIVIFRSTSPSALRYTARANDTPIAADTLEGMRALIRAALGLVP